MSTATLVRDARIGAERSEVWIAGGLVTQIAPHPGDRLPAARGVEVVEARGAALVPGLHDHHIHLLALAAALESVAVGPGSVSGSVGFAAALRSAPVAGGWIRAVGYHESVAGDLDRHMLDRLVPDHPVRVQHRSGALWILNSAALARVARVLDASDDVERDANGEPTGRLWRYDARLRPALPSAAPDLAPVGRLLAGFGVTGVTDATPDLDAAAIDLLARAHAAGDLPQSILLLGAPDDLELPPGLARGPWKILLRDHDLPALGSLIDEIRGAHSRARPVAVHCVTRESLILTLAAFEAAGSLPGDRIEHAAVVPAEIRSWLARLGVRVVTQPDFLRTRTAAYRRDVDPDDRPYLYPYRSLLDAGIPVCASSDAPYGDPDPWRAMATAIDRPLVPDENISPAVVFDGYLSAGDDPGGPPRTVAPGAPADLVLLNTSLEEVLSDPCARHVRTTFIRGVPHETPCPPTR